MASIGLHCQPTLHQDPNGQMQPVHTILVYPQVVHLSVEEVRAADYLAARQPRPAFTTHLIQGIRPITGTATYRVNRT